MGRRSGSLALLAAVAAALVLAAIPGTVFAVNDLTDGIAAGIVDDGGTFGTSAVTVPQHGYVTYIAQGAGSLAGTPVEIWRNSGGGWTKATSRTFAADGSVRYFARITGKTSFQARIPGTPGGSAHGRSATTWSSAADRRTKVVVGCDDWDQGDSNILIDRTVSLKSGTELVVTLCANPSTGFGWRAAATDSAHLKVLGHTFSSPTSTSNPPVVGGNGLETWTFLVTGHGEGHAVLSYDGPAGRPEAAWIFVLETRD